MRKESEVHLDAAIEVNEIHTAVSRSFVRPKATSPSLPACLFRVLLESVEHQGDENTSHPVYATAPTKSVCCKQASMVLRVSYDSLYLEWTIIVSIKAAQQNQKNPPDILKESSKAIQQPRSFCLIKFTQTILVIN